VIFHDTTIVVGSATSRRTHDTARLAPAAVEVFRDLVERHGASFRVPLPVRGLAHLELQWTSYGTAAMATFWARAPVTTSALAAGLDAGEDRDVLQALQSLILHFHGDSPLEPAFDVLAIPDRPLLATVPIPAPPTPDMGIIADAETCLAAAFFLSILGGA
jgi:hypothetical protein